jgi:hypothetical protein
MEETPLQFPLQFQRAEPTETLELVDGKVPGDHVALDPKDDMDGFSSDYGSEGWGFESLRARYTLTSRFSPNRASHLR